MSSLEHVDIWSAVWNGLRAKEVAPPPRQSTLCNSTESEQRDVLLFRRGATQYAVPTSSLRQIRALQRFCRIPGAASVVPGVIYYRGEILGVHDLAAFLDQPATDSAEAWALVLESGNQRLGLLADDVYDIRPLQKGACQPVPPSLGRRGDCFTGQLSDGTLVLAPPKLFATATFFQAR